MASLYTHQSSNITKTWLLMSLFFIIIIGVGYAVSYVYQEPAILYIVAIFSIVLNITAYWFSDKIALSSAHAHPAYEHQYGELHNIVENLSITAGLPKPRVYIINDQSPNAFATGRDPAHSAVAVTTGLLALLDRNELEGVIAHELAHIGNRDILVATVVVVLVGILAMVSDLFLRSMLFGGDSRREGGSGQLGLILALVGIILAPIVGTLIQLAISRKREYLADASGALLTRYPEGLAGALSKICMANIPVAHATTATAHLYISNPFGNKGNFVSKLFSTHPPVEKRIEALLGHLKAK